MVINGKGRNKVHTRCVLLFLLLRRASQRRDDIFKVETTKTLTIFSYLCTKSSLETQLENCVKNTFHIMLQMVKFYVNITQNEYVKVIGI